MIGLVSWLLTLFGFIIDEIFTLADYLEENVEGSNNIPDLINQKGGPQYLLDLSDAHMLIQFQSKT